MCILISNIYIKFWHFPISTAGGHLCFYSAVRFIHVGTADMPVVFITFLSLVIFTYGQNLFYIKQFSKLWLYHFYIINLCILLDAFFFPDLFRFWNGLIILLYRVHESDSLHFCYLASLSNVSSNLHFILIKLYFSFVNLAN